MPDPRVPRLRRFVRTQVAPFALMLALMASFRSAVADWNVVPTGSMNPTIVEGDRIFVNKLAYGLRVPFTGWYVGRWAEPARGDVVVFPSPADRVRLVKRVVALPGETVEMIDNQLLINGQPAAYGPAGVGGPLMEQLGPSRHPVQFMRRRTGARRSFGPVTVPPGHYFVLGDNRDASADSRYFGFVPRDSITGRSSAVVVSLDPRTYGPRWDRTFQPLP